MTLAEQAWVYMLPGKLRVRMAAIWYWHTAVLREVVFNSRYRVSRKNEYAEHRAPGADCDY